MANPWNGFRPGRWQQTIDVRDFIQRNYTPYTGDESFLAPATERTQALMKKLNNLFSLEREFGGVLDIDTTTVTSLLNYKPGYLDKDREIIVGLQTDRPLKRGVNPFGRHPDGPFRPARPMAMSCPPGGGGIPVPHHP